MTLIQSCEGFSPVRDSLRTGLWYYNPVLDPSPRFSGLRKKLLIASLILGSFLPAGCRRDPFNNRPNNAKINTIVVHSINPGGDNPSTADAEDMLREEEVSAHYIIGRDGEVSEMVSENKRAWHAGRSHFPFDPKRVADVNDFSLGVELVTTNDLDFTEKQYEALTKLINSLNRRYEIVFIVGHEHIAAKRSVPKKDPGDKFDWQRLIGGIDATDGGKWVFKDNQGIVKLKVKNQPSPSNQSSRKKKRF